MILISNIHFVSFGQSLTSGIPLFDEVSRNLQYYGKDSLVSFCVRPIYTSNSGVDSLLNYDNVKKSTAAGSFTKTQLVFLPVSLQQQYNTHHPYGWNDGSMIPAKGYENQFSFGVFLKKGFLSLQLRPEIVFAQNSSFPAFPNQQSDTIWRAYYYSVLNKIDAPERFGSSYYLKLFPGQSSLRFNYHKISLGISTENLWWGPGVRNSLLMSDNAPGFPHISFNSLQPVTSAVGSFEWQLISGKLKASGILPDTTRKFNGTALYDAKEDDDRYLNGIILTWQPKWTKGLFIGFSRVFYEYFSSVSPSLDGYLPVIGKLFKGATPNEDEKRRDQMLSFFFRFFLAKEKAEFYGEFGRNDHSQNARDFLLEPEHSRAYIIGFSKIFDGTKKDVQLFGEITNLQMASTMLLRAEPTWYIHHQVRHGYTNYGQVIGAGIGPGSSSQTLGLQWGSGFNKIGGTIERVVHNNDFYYDAFTPAENWQKHWVDVSLNFNKSWVRNRIVYDAHLSAIQSLNYEWYYNNVLHFNARIGVHYLF